MSKKMPVKKAASKNFFDPVDLHVNFPDEEKKLLERWNKKGIVKKYLQKNKKSKKYFSFVDGPITANNPMGVHHAWGRTYKDLWPRFFSMLGYKQRYQNGFDCQGLWVEVEVEKELNFRSKKDIEAFGVEKFVNLCRERVKKYSIIQTEQSKRLGYFADWDHSYYTMSDDNNYMIWRFLKVVDDNGWLYKGNDSAPWCPRCETAISQHEMLTEDYKEVTHESVFLAFPIVGRESEYLMVWTTTPWTIPANIGVAIDNNLLYCLVEVESSPSKGVSKKYWIAKDAIERVLKGVSYKIVKEVRGEKLVGLKYVGAFDYLPKVKEVSEKFSNKFHNVVATDNLIMPITVTEGTGLVHTAVSAGVEDFKLGQKLGLPMIPVINDDASYMEGFDFLSGKNAKKHPELILDYLRKLDLEGKHFYFKTEHYTHRYPACWRCKTELVWKVTDEWYIAMDKPTKITNSKLQITNAENTRKDTGTLRERMVAVANKINWIPGFGLDRELDWLNNMHDWLVSKKNRYWGLALPIWECVKCNNFQVIGSRDELKEKAIEGWKDFEGKSPHKPQIDKVKIKCSKCGKVISRIEPVGNPWLDAGIVPFSTISSDNKACNLTETTGRPLYLKDKKEWLNWFPASFITESFPGQFKNWFYSMIAMSTVLENTNPFKTVLGYGTLLGEDGRPMHKSWGNSIEFLEGADKIGVDVMRWMFVRQNPAENMLFGYKIADEVRRRFHLKLWNVYNFFVTYANLDDYKPKKIVNSPKAKNILDKWILIRLRETILKVRESMELFDPFTASSEIEIFLDDLSNWYIRRSRDRVGINIGDEKDKRDFYDTCFYTLSNFCKILAPFNPFISDLIYSNLTKEISIHLVDWPNSEKITGVELQILSEMKNSREIVENIHASRKEMAIPVRQPLSSAKVSYRTSKIRSEILKIAEAEVNVKTLIVNNFVKGKTEIVVTLDTKITPELEEEARTRELIRDIQEQRKQTGVELRQWISVSSPWLPKLSEQISKIKRITLAKELNKGDFKVKIAS